MIGVWFFAVVVAFEAKVDFSAADFALVPQGAACPGVCALDAALVGVDPGVMIHHSIEAEELNLTEFAAELSDEVEHLIDIICGIGKVGTENENPTADWGRDE